MAGCNSGRIAASHPGTGSGTSSLCHQAGAQQRGYPDLGVLQRRPEPQRLSTHYATGTYNVLIFGYYHFLNFSGRSSNITVSLLCQPPTNRSTKLPRGYE